ncbi:MAG: CPBP family glutamic-type intramembrane protease [Euzebya sp.]
MPADVDVFSRFARDGSGGTGLGMYTVKRILELHQGTIELERTPGGGTTARRIGLGRSPVSPLSSELHDRVPVEPSDFVAPTMDQRARRYAIPWEWFDAVVVYFVWFALLGALALGVQTLVSDSDVQTAVVLPVAAVVLVVVTVVWIAVRSAAGGLPDGRRRLVGVKRPEARDLAIGVGYGVAAFLVIQLGLGTAVSALVQALGREVPQIQEGVQTSLQGQGTLPLVIAFAVAVLAPMGEELLFRGVLYQALAKHMPGWPAVGLSGLAFGLTHVELFVVVLTFPLGMFLAWTLRRHGTLLVPILAHAVFNLIGVVLIRLGGA